VYVVGSSFSTDYPVTSGTAGSPGFAMVTKVNADGASLQYSLFLNGDFAYGVAVDSARRANVAGDTPGSPPDRDVFFSRINAAGTFAIFETVLAGTFRDIGYGVDVDLAGNAYIAGVTSSSSFPADNVVNLNPLQSTIAVVPDGFVAKIDTDTPVAVGKSAPPSQLRVDQNYPNPFNPATTIEFHLATASTVNLSIFDSRGRHVATLVNETRPRGRNQVQWDGKNHLGRPAASGVYFYRVTTDGLSLTKKMVLMK